MYGNQVPRYENEARSVIGEASTSLAGNLILRVGRERATPLLAGATTWEQTEHVVLTPAEHRDLIVELGSLEGTRNAGGGPGGE